MPVFRPGSDDEALLAEVALGHLDVLGHDLRNGRADDHVVDVAEAEAAQREQVGVGRRQLVGGRVAVGGEPPVLEQLSVLEGAEVRLGVADVDREQHVADQTNRYGGVHLRLNGRSVR